MSELQPRQLAGLTLARTGLTLGVTLGFALLALVAMGHLLEQQVLELVLFGVLAGLSAIPLEAVQRQLRAWLPGRVRYWGFLPCLGTAYVCLAGSVFLAVYFGRGLRTGVWTSGVLAGPLQPLIDAMGQDIPGLTAFLLWVLIGPTVAFAAAADWRLSREAGETSAFPPSTVLILFGAAMILGALLGLVRSHYEPWLHAGAAIYGMMFQPLWASLWGAPLLFVARVMRRMEVRLEAEAQSQSPPRSAHEG